MYALQEWYSWDSWLFYLFFTFWENPIVAVPIYISQICRVGFSFLYILLIIFCHLFSWWWSFCQEMESQSSFNFYFPDMKSIEYFKKYFSHFYFFFKEISQFCSSFLFHCLLFSSLHVLDSNSPSVLYLTWIFFTILKAVVSLDPLPLPYRSFFKKCIRFIHFISHESYLHVCMYTSCMSGAHRAKRGLNSVVMDVCEPPW